LLGGTRRLDGKGEGPSEGGKSFEVGDAGSDEAAEGSGSTKVTGGYIGGEGDLTGRGLLLYAIIARLDLIQGTWR
jgi:hypothetical protein